MTTTDPQPRENSGAPAQQPNWGGMAAQALAVLLYLVLRHLGVL